MDIIGSTAAISQLLGQAIYALQQIYQAREAVRLAPKTLNDMKAHLSNLVGTVEEIHDESSLHTPAICTQLRVIYDIATELNHILKAMERLQQKSKLHQGVYALVKRQRDEGRLNDVMRNLGAAKAELAIRIDVAHVRMTRGVAKGVARIGRDVQTTMQKETGSHYHQFQIESNEASDSSRQLNGIMGIWDTASPTTAVVRENKAIGDGTQHNLILGDIASLKFYQGMSL